MVSSIQAAVVDDVRSAIAIGDFANAEKLLAADSKAQGVTADGLFAESWLARALLDKGELEPADKHAVAISTKALLLLRTRKLDNEPILPLALGAAIEVHAQAMAKRGQRADGVAYLRVQSIRWKGTSIQARIQKNLNLLNLEGKAAPPLEIAQWTGPSKPVPLSSYRGHPVLLFFWAHWCPDCKNEVPVIQDLLTRYGSAGLKVIAPTMHYGFTGGGEEATAAKESEWIEQTRQKYYARMGAVPVPVSEVTLRLYGVSTTPTLVLVDGTGTVRLYHPGVMSYQELAPLVGKLLNRPA